MNQPRPPKLPALVPDVTAATWVQVVTNAGRRCQCEGACGHPHTTGTSQPTPVEGRCPANATQTPAAHLYPTPTDPSVPASQAWRLPVSALTAWCGPCLHAAHRKHQRPPTPEPPNPPPRTP